MHVVKDGRLNEPFSPDDCVYHVNVAVVGGGRDFILTRGQLDAYNANPDAFVARRLGFAGVRQYFDWIELNGAARCAATTARGNPCRNTVGFEMEPEEWIALDLDFYCRAHGGHVGSAVKR